ncbi:MAG: hypothetical protein GOV01_00690 [Candidatus Altiarchaeota archaeon]|nr:hypothetical protein [Candidatus Altiarchaeota archaeon]
MSLDSLLFEAMTGSSMGNVFMSVILVTLFIIIGTTIASILFGIFEALRGNLKLGALILSVFIGAALLFEKTGDLTALLVYFSMMGLLLFVRLLLITFRNVNKLVRK